MVSVTGTYQYLCHFVCAAVLATSDAAILGCSMLSNQVYPMSHLTHPSPPQTA
jgi:hypothetical protein